MGKSKELASLTYSGVPVRSIEVILLRVLFTAKVLTNLRWQGGGDGGGGGAAYASGGSRVAGDPMKGVLS